MLHKLWGGAPGPRGSPRTFRSLEESTLCSPSGPAWGPAVDLSINPNTVVRAYRELEIRGALETQQGTGTFVSHQKVKRDDVERRRQLDQLVTEFVSRAGSAGFTLNELLNELQERKNDAP